MLTVSVFCQTKTVEIKVKNKLCTTEESVGEKETKLNEVALEEFKNYLAINKFLFVEEDHIK